MPNEILYAGLANQRQAAALNMAFLLLASERSALPNHPVLAAGYKLLGPGESTTTVNLPFVGLAGYDLMAPVGEGVAVPLTQLTDATVQVTVGRQAKAYGAGDVARATDGLGILNTTVMALDAIKAKSATLVSMFMNVVNDYTATCGTPGSAYTVPQHQAGVYTLDAQNMPGPYLAMYALKQWFDLQAYMTANAGGALQYTPAAADVIARNGAGAKGHLLGADIFASTFAPQKNSGVNVAGGIVAPGGLAWAEAQFANDSDQNQLLLGQVEAAGQAAPGTLMIERDREAFGGVTSWVQAMIVGVARGRDAHGVSAVTKRAV